jgi:hypothetical protein
MTAKKKPKPRKAEPDPNVTAFGIVQRIIQKTEAPGPKPKAKRPKR